MNPDDPRPPYVQVADQLRSAIETGRYASGDKLPSRADIASMFDVAPMTVQRALQVLRDDGLIVSRQGRGVFVRRVVREDAETRNRKGLRLLRRIHRQNDEDPPRCDECVGIDGRHQRWPCRTMQEVAPILAATDELDD